jgi:hypothetical protein
VAAAVHTDSLCSAGSSCWGKWFAHILRCCSCDQANTILTVHNPPRRRWSHKARPHTAVAATERGNFDDWKAGAAAGRGVRRRAEREKRVFVTCCANSCDRDCVDCCDPPPPEQQRECVCGCSQLKTAWILNFELLFCMKKCITISTFSLSPPAPR